jgi:ribosome-interacting GTPase 1
MQGKDRGRKEEKTTSNNSNTYTNKVDKTTTTLYLIKKKKNEKVIAIKANKQANKGKMAEHIWVSNEIIQTWRAPRRFGYREGSDKFEGLWGI